MLWETKLSAVVRTRVGMAWMDASGAHPVRQSLVHDRPVVRSVGGATGSRFEPRCAPDP